MSNIIKKYFQSKVSPRPYVFVFDLVTTLFSTIGVFVFFLGLEPFAMSSIRVISTAVFVILFINAISFVVFKTYSGVLRFSVFSDLIKIVYALTIGYLVSFMVLYFLDLGTSFIGLMRIVSSIFFFNVFLMIISRIVIKEIYEGVVERGDKQIPVFVYGTKQIGVNLGKGIRRNTGYKYKLMGFIASDSDMVGKKLVGVDVYEYNEKLFDILDKKNIGTIIVSQGRFEDENIQDVLESFAEHGVKLLTTTSPFSEWGEELNLNSQLKEVEIEDLLPRTPININMREIASNLEGKRVMITGAAGSIGSEIVCQVARFNPYSLILIDQAETPLHDLRLKLKEKWVNVKAETIVADISNESRMSNIFKKAKPHYIFHAAAYKHVPMMEDNVSESIQNNVLGTKILADLAVKHNVQKFVMVSTDKAVNPSNIMGTSKRICEIYVQSLAKHLEVMGNVKTQFITTRFGNVLGSNGSVIPHFREQIKNGGPVTVTHPEIIRYFMTIPEACKLVLEAGAMGKGGEIYLFDMGKPVKIIDLAKRMISLSGARGVRIEFTGLRHGEKLYEELLNTEENTIKTHHEKIMIARVQEYDYNEVKEKIDDLILTSYHYDNMRTVKKMKELVPEFHSLNSPYESVDRILEKEKQSSN